MLAELYANIKEEIVLAPAPRLNPETGGPAYGVAPSGKMIPVTGGSTLVVEAPEIQNSPKVLATIRERAIAPPNAGFEADAYVDIPNHKVSSGIKAVAVAGFAMPLAALCGGGFWFWKRKTSSSSHNIF